MKVMKLYENARNSIGRYNKKYIEFYQNPKQRLIRATSWLVVSGLAAYVAINIIFKNDDLSNWQDKYNLGLGIGLSLLSATMGIFDAKDVLDIYRRNRTNRS